MIEGPVSPGRGAGGALWRATRLAGARPSRVAVAVAFEQFVAESQTQPLLAEEDLLP